MKADKPFIVFMLAIWGEVYIRQFFQFGLRSLLAPGNIPSLNDEFPCTFLFLTLKKDIAFFKTQPELALLNCYCEIEFIDIVDLIFEQTYSATLTLAFERGMRSRGEQMLETYFFYFVSDYIVANNSLKNLKHYIQTGYSGITAGNFLVVEEYVAPIFKTIMKDDQAGLLTIEARSLLKIAFPHMHPVSTAQTVTQDRTHASHANRLFWKVNEHLLVGRFYLRHMLCIKPETDRFLIGSSCDYSFIAEMCPSGNVVHIQDSDIYCVIEMAPYSYEQNWIKAGPFDQRKLAEHMSAWTTAYHRANAHIPVIYHTEDLDGNKEILHTGSEWIHALEKMMNPEVQPVRGHYYWLSCIECIIQWIHQQPEKEIYYKNGSLAGIFGKTAFAPILRADVDDRFILKSAPSNSLPLNLKTTKKRKWLKIFMGLSPDTKPWHLTWFDDLFFRKHFQQQLEAATLIAFEPIPELVRWIESKSDSNHSFQFYELFIRRTQEDLKKIFFGKKDIIFFMSKMSFHNIGLAIRRCATLLPSNTTFSIYINPKQPFSNRLFEQEFSICQADLSNFGITLKEKYLYYGIPTCYFQKWQNRAADRAFFKRKKLLTRIRGYAVLSVLLTLCLAGNTLSLMRKKSKKKSTSAILKFSF